MNQKTVIYIIVGAAATGIAYYLWKQEQVAAAPPTPSAQLSNAVSGAYNSTVGLLQNNYQYLPAFF